jgi:hypothetical protein
VQAGLAAVVGLASTGLARFAAEHSMDAEISVDAVWEVMGKKLEHMLSSFAENDVEHAQLDAGEWMRMYT